MKKRHKDWLLHLGAGVVIALLCLALPGWLLAILVPLGVGHAREAEQERFDAKLRHPSMFWKWDSHRVNEWMAWGIGGALVTAIYALSR